jgi:hypothetical protein
LDRIKSKNTGQEKEQEKQSNKEQKPQRKEEINL